MTKRFLFIFILAAAFTTLGVRRSMAAGPTGSNWFQILASPFTGGDNTGDGGTGSLSDLNYYYVGQSFTGTIQIGVTSSSGSTASNIWIDYATTTVSATNLAVGSFFANWSGQTVSSTIGRIFSTGYQTSGSVSGTGTFGTATFTMLRPTAVAYGTGASTTLTLNVGQITQTTESNISYAGADILDGKEDFRMFVWADTIKPYALNPYPTAASTTVPVDVNFTFDLRDSKNGEGDNSGVGTGVNTSRPPGAILFHDTAATTSYVGSDSYSCSGTWGTNLCSVTVNPTSPSGISGDTRNWKYNTTYTVSIGGFRDMASTNQNQLGDANGPNVMNTSTFTFTTQTDTVKPIVTVETPLRGSMGNATNTNLTIDVTDRRSSGGPSGTGVATSTCYFSVSSASFAATVYSTTSSGVSVAQIDYGVRYTIDPATNFGQNETVSVSAYGCSDIASNVMTTDNWTFNTSDSDAPYVDGQNPANDGVISAGSNIVFHIKDAGSGVSLANTVIFLNGSYYTNAGGAGEVTTSGTRITFTSSLNFNGGNYAGDTTVVTGSASDYTFTLDPQSNFTAGEALPIIIFSRDASGNLMDYVVYAAVVEGGSCSSVACTTSAATCPVTGGGGSSEPQIAINDSTVRVDQVDAHSVLVSWTSNAAGSARVAYDVRSPAEYGAPPNFNYRFSTPEYQDNATYHAVLVSDLVSGVLYFFRPVTVSNGKTVRGPELRMAPRFSQEVFTERIIEIRTVTTTVIRTVTTTIPVALRLPAVSELFSCPRPAYVPRTIPTAPVPSAPSHPTVVIPAQTVAPAITLPSPSGALLLPLPSAPRSPFRIVDVIRLDRGWRIVGQWVPNAPVRITVY